MNQDSWMQNPALKNIDPEKLRLLLSLAGQAQGKTPAELLPFLMSSSARTQEQDLSFAPSEIEAIIQVLKTGKSPQEIQKIDRLCALIRQFRSQNPPSGSPPWQNRRK